MNLGDAFFNLPDGSGYPSHIWFVISRPNGAQRVVIVNVSSNDDGYTDLPILTRADYPRLHHDSFIRADYAQMQALVQLRRKLTEGLFEPTPPLTRAALVKVQRAVHGCRHTEREIQLTIEDQGFIWG